MGRVKQTGALIILALLSTIFVATGSASNVSAFTMSITSSEDASIDILPDKDSDTSTNISVDDVNVVTTCRAGYNLTMSTSVNNNNLYLNGDSTNNTTGTYFTPVNGTSPLNTSTNSWGYFFSNVARSQTPTVPTKTSVFSPVPTSNATPATLKTTTQTASSADINDTLQVYLGVTMNSSITPGSYKMIPESNQSGAENGSLIYYLTMDGSCNTVNIAYDGNNADAGTMGAAGTGVIHTNVKDGDNISLIASNFSRTGYGFAGWSFDKDAGTKLLDNNNTNNPVVYGPQEDITLPDELLNYDTDSDGIVKLYAVWLQSQGDLQGWMGCNNLDTATYDSTTGKLDLTKNSVTALTDQRDHQTYAVARLADGQCWMIENLRLDNNATNPNWGDDNLSQGFGGAFVGLANPEIANFNDSTTANSLYSTSNITGSYQGYRFPRYNNQNTATPAANITRNDANIYSYGNWYTWAAAIADTSYYTSGTHNTTSICPTGWSIPIGDQTTVNKSFGALSVALGGPANGADADSSTTPTGTVMSGIFRSYPNNFLSSGYFYIGSPSNRGSSGSYWSSTVLSGGGSYYLNLGSSGVYPGTGRSTKYNGYSVRCVVPSNLYAIHFDTNTTGTVTGTMPDQSITADTATNLRSNAFQRPATSSVAYRFVKWNTKPDGTGTDYTDGVSVTNLASVGQTITLYAIWEQVTPMIINFQSNGLSFADSSTANTVYYTNTCGNATVGTTPRYSHTPNIDDNGTQNSNYANNYTMNDVVTINNASKLKIELTYGGESANYDWVSVWSGSHPTFTAANDYNDSSKVNMGSITNNKYGGGSGTTATGTISGNSVTFAFKSDSGGVGNGYGYYAVVTALDANGNTLNTGDTTQVCSRSLVNGEYKTPVVDSLRTFYGWNENQSATTADYATADDILNNLPGSNGETKTLYAIWKNNLTINYNANGGTGTVASQLVAAGESITLKNNSFTAPTNKRFKNWNTSPDGTGTSYSANTNFTAPDNVAYNDSITLYAIWEEVYYIAFNANESSVGATSGSATGTMANQTVARDTATAIKTSTYALSGYIFLGWNTAANGSGTFYSDGQKVTNLTTTGNTITLYAVWTDGAYLDTGSSVNQKLKRLAGNSTATSSTQDNTITALVRSNTLPADFTPATENTISHSSSPTPIYAWYDSGTIYYYSEATDILMNKTSSNLFREMRVLSNLSTISNWDTTKVIDMSSMFYYAGYSSGTWSVGDLSSWNTASVTDVRSMFSYAGYSATTWSIGDLSSWNTASVTSMYGMFSNAGYNATTWSVGDLSSWNTAIVTNMQSMFQYAGYNATTWSVGDLSSWNTTSVTNMQSMFSNAGRNSTTWSVGNLSSWNTTSVTNMSNMFHQAGYNATTWSVGDLSSWNTASVTDMQSMFQYAGYNATTWSVGDLSSWNIASVTNMQSMFYSAGYSSGTWSVGDLSSWNTASVTNMRSMFTFAGYSATTFTLDLSSWNTASVTDMSSMFYQAGYNATTFNLDLSSWNTASVTNMQSMFSSAGYSATTFTLDLSSWNTASVTNMNSMFSYAGYRATTWSVTIPRTNGAASPISNTTSNLYGNSTSVTATPPSGKSFTLAN